MDTSNRAAGSLAAVAFAALAVALAALFTSCATPPPDDGFTSAWSAAEIAAAPSFGTDDKIVATHYFYWYRYPTEHFFDDPGQTDDALQDHFVDPEMVDYTSVEWHAGELADMVEAGIDVLLPVYWGAPDHYQKADIAFSVNGLPALQQAIDDRLARGVATPKVGMFYDTSTLLPEVRGESRPRYDLTTAEGKDIFYRTIRGFFDRLHPRVWATIEGRPLVVLYSAGFVADHNQSTINYVYDSFERDFGVRPYVIRDASWRFRADGTTAWGTALGGPHVSGTVAQIGPGYNDTAVPGRSTPIRDREDGNFYRLGWRRVMESNARIVLLETWNELHEATGICRTVEHGSTYIDLTARYAAAWKAGATPEGEAPAGVAPAESIELRHPDPLPRPASTEGAEFAAVDRVTFDPAAPARGGLHLVEGVADGPATIGRHGETPVVRSATQQSTYLYFAVVDPFVFDAQTPITIEYEYLDDGHARHILQYDSHDRSATLSGAYKDHGSVGIVGGGGWKTVTATLPDARFVNRQNGGADFRFAVVGGSLTLRRIEVVR